MSSLVTQMIVAEKYGLRLSMDELAQVLKLTKVALYNQISAERCPIVTYTEAGKRWADYRAVADYIDACATRAERACGA